MALAAQYFSSLIDEEVSESDFFRIAAGRIAIFMKPRTGKGIAAFAGFYGEEFKQFLSGAGWGSEHAAEDSLRIDVPVGAWPKGLNFLEDELPYPLMWGFFDGPPTVESKTSDGSEVYWMLWDSAKKEISSIKPFDLDSFELCVEPKSVYELAMLTLDDGYWPEPASQFTTSMEVSPPNELANIVFDTPPTRIFSAPFTSYQEDDGFSNLFGPLQERIAGEAKPKIKKGYNWPVIAGALLDLLTEGKRVNQAGVVTALVERDIWGLKQRTLDGALAQAKEAFAARKEK